MVPVRYETDGEERYSVVHRDDLTEDHTELNWDDFHSEINERNMLVVRQGEEEPELNVLDRSEALGRSAVEQDDVQEALLEGETVEAELTERTVVEHTIVEEATVESEIIDREVVESETVDAELLTTEVDHCSVDRLEEPDQSPTVVERFEPGVDVNEPYAVEFEVDEGWTLTKEFVERLTIESRITDTDVEGTQTVETDTLEETIDLEGVQERVLEGELVNSSQSAADIIDDCHVESQFREDNAIETYLLRRKTVEEEMSVRKEFNGEVSTGETISADAISSSVVGTEIMREEDYDVDVLAISETEMEEGDVVEEETVVAEEEETVVAEEEETVVAEEDETVVAEEETEVVETDTTVAEEDVTTGERVVPTEAEEGKTVVDASGDEVGMVVDVEEDTMYVDAHPSITERIRTALGWGDHDEENYPIDNDQVARIEENEVVLGVEREK